MTDEPFSVPAFLDEMEADDFPQSCGPWRSFGWFDPPFNRSILRSMRKAGVIELDEAGKRFRLTMQATDKRAELARTRDAALSALAENDAEEIANG